MTIQLFQIDAASAQILGFDEGRWVAKFGSDERTETLMKPPQDGDEYLIIGGGHCETVVFVADGDEDVMIGSSRDAWADGDPSTLAGYKLLLEKNCQGLRRRSPGLAAFLAQPWTRIAVGSR